MVTEQQIELLNDAFKATLGTPDYLKYKCEWYLKSSKSGQWKFSIWGNPCPFKAGYFKVIRGEIYIYSMDNEERIKLNEDCLELLGITPETFKSAPAKKIKKEKKPAPQKTLKQELRGLDPLEKRNYLKSLFNRTSWEFIFYILPCDPEYQELEKDPDFHEGDFSPLYEMGFDSWERVRELALECSKENIKNEKYDSRKIIQRVNKIMNVA